MLLYYVLIALVGFSWWAWRVVPADWWRGSNAGETPSGGNVLPTWRQDVLFVGLITLSLSMLQHLGLVVYEDVLHHRVNHFSSPMGLLVGANIVTCYFSLAASAVGKGFARLPLFAASILLIFFWGISRAV
jgi:hypothetical protein